MFDINRHKYFLVQILKDIYSDMELANYLGFKGGTALKVPFATHLENCIKHLENISSKNMLDGLGELTDAEMKKFVKTKLMAETISLLKYYQKFPILSK